MSESLEVAIKGAQHGQALETAFMLGKQPFDLAVSGVLGYVAEYPGLVIPDKRVTELPAGIREVAFEAAFGGLGRHITSGDVRQAFVDTALEHIEASELGAGDEQDMVFVNATLMAEALNNRFPVEAERREKQKTAQNMNDEPVSEYIQRLTGFDRLLSRYDQLDPDLFQHNIERMISVASSLGGQLTRVNTPTRQINITNTPAGGTSIEFMEKLGFGILRTQAIRRASIDEEGLPSLSSLSSEIDTDRSYSRTVRITPANQIDVESQRAHKGFTGIIICRDIFHRENTADPDMRNKTLEGTLDNAEMIRIASRGIFATIRGELKTQIEKIAKQYGSVAAAQRALADRAKSAA